MFLVSEVGNACDYVEVVLWLSHLFPRTRKPNL